MSGPADTVAVPVAVLRALVALAGRVQSISPAVDLGGFVRAAMLLALDVDAQLSVEVRRVVDMRLRPAVEPASVLDRDGLAERLQLEQAAVRSADTAGGTFVSRYDVAQLRADAEQSAATEPASAWLAWRLLAVLTPPEPAAAPVDVDELDDPISAGTPIFPTSLDEVPAEATLAELGGARAAHLFALVVARADVDDAELARHALACLALDQAVVDSLAVERWRVARDALLYGATMVEVGAALAGLQRDEIAVAVRRWADQRLDDGLMDADEHAQAMALVAGGAR